MIDFEEALASVELPEWVLKKPSLAERMRLWRAGWIMNARPKQHVDFGAIHRDTILFHPGRGWGKTEVLNQWMSWDLLFWPGMIGHVVAATHNDTRYTVMEGPTGILSLVPRELIADYNKTDSIVVFEGGSKLRGFSSEEPERLRGPQCIEGDVLIRMADGSQKPIKYVWPDDLVATRAGPKRVLAQVCTSPCAVLWELTTSCGGKLCATMDHKIYSGGEFIELCKLNPGDPLLSYSTKRNTTGRPQATGNGPSALVPGSLDAGYVVTYTATFTNTTSGAYPSGMTYTTGTTTAPITTHQTSSPSQWMNIAANTASGAISLGVPEQSYQLDGYGSGTTASLAMSNAPNAALTFYPAAPASQENAVRSNADQNGDGETVVSVEQLGFYGAVYDLEVEDAHEFYAGDILVHNCAILGCDELAAWKSDRETWQQARFGHRLRHPQYGRSLAVVTTTPKPKALIQEMFKDPTILKIGGDTKENEQNLSETFMKDMERLRGTRLGRQELAGELLEAEELGVIKRSQWKQFPVGAKIPPLDLVIMSLDTAFTEENVDVENQDQDYTACTVWGCYREKLANGEYEPRIILLWAWQERLGFPDLVERVRKDREKTYGNYEMRGVVTPMFGMRGPAMKTGRKADMVLIEDKGSGISLRQTLRRSGIPVHPYNPGKADKYLRLNLTAPLFVAGYVYAPQSENHPEEFKSWAEPLVGQMCAYAGEDSLEHEDLMDSATQALLWIDRNWLRSLPPKYATREQALRSDWRVQGRGNPYAR